LDFKIDGQVMGSLVERAPADARALAEVRGTAPIEKLELFEGNRVVETVRPRAFSNLSHSNRIRISWRGSRIRGRGRRVNWDGSIRVAGAKIIDAKPTFDTPIDRITKIDGETVQFISQTTGDTDFIDLTLDSAKGQGVAFVSKAGECSIELRELSD